MCQLPSWSTWAKTLAGNAGQASLRVALQPTRHDGPVPASLLPSPWQGEQVLEGRAIGAPQQRDAEQRQQAPVELQRIVALVGTGAAAPSTTTADTAAVVPVSGTSSSVPAAAWCMGMGAGQTRR